MGVVSRFSGRAERSFLGGIVAGMGSAMLSDEIGKAFDAFELPGWFPVRKITEEEEREMEEEKILPRQNATGDDGRTRRK